MNEFEYVWYLKGRKDERQEIMISVKRRLTHIRHEYGGEAWLIERALCWMLDKLEARDALNH